MLHPGEVGVARGRHAVLPTLVVAQPLAAPVGDVEGRIREDEVGFEVGVAVVMEGVAVVKALSAARRGLHPPAHEALGTRVGLVPYPGAYALSPPSLSPTSVRHKL